MKKKTISVLAVVILVFVLVPMVLCVAIYVTNNYIADKIESELLDYQLPSNTKIINSASVAGKLTGNGNGMQYMGAILVKTELSEDELLEYYSSKFNYIEISRQNAENILNSNSDCYTFGYFPDMDVNTYYSITCWDSEEDEMFSNFIIGLLNLDIRGH